MYQIIWKIRTGAELKLAQLMSTIIFLVGNSRLKFSKLQYILYDFYELRRDNNKEISTQDWEEIIKISQNKDYFSKSYLLNELKYLAICYFDK
jgi:hypothetical protein